MWTQFYDMNSGGGQKLDWGKIYIEAPMREAQIIFQNMFGRNPNRVTCTCCGADYSITEYTTLEQATAYDRGCAFDKESDSYIEEPIKDRRSFEPDYETLADYLAKEEGKYIRVVREQDIQPKDRTGTLREEGFIWAGGD